MSNRFRKGNINGRRLRLSARRKRQNGASLAEWRKSFPKDPNRRKRWTLNLRRVNFIPSDHSKVCSKHFAEDCFDREKFGGRWLKSTAVPTIFDFSTHSSSKLSRKSSTKKRSAPSLDIQAKNYKTRAWKPPNKTTPLDVPAKKQNKAAKAAASHSDALQVQLDFTSEDQSPNRIAANSASDVPDKAESILPDVPNLAIVKKEPVDDTEEIFPSTSRNIPSLQSLDSFMPSVKLEIATSEDCVDNITIPVNPNDIAPPATSTDTGGYSSTKFICTDGTEPPPKRPNLSQIPSLSNTEIKDEFSIFGNYVADKIRSFADRGLQVEAQHLITNLLFEIEMKKDLNKDSLPVISQFSSVQKPLPTKVILPPSTATRKISKSLTAKVMKSSSIPISYTPTLQTQIPATVIDPSSSTVMIPSLKTSLPVRTVLLPSSAVNKISNLQAQLPAAVMLPSNSAIRMVSNLQVQMPSAVRSPSSSPISVAPSLKEQMPVTVTLPTSSSINRVSSLQAQMPVTVRSSSSSPISVVPSLHEKMPVTVTLPTSSSTNMVSNLQIQLPTTVMLPSTSISSFTSKNTENLNIQVKPDVSKQN